jgi:hypothetical protein
VRRAQGLVKIDARQTVRDTMNWGCGVTKMSGFFEGRRRTVGRADEV